MELNYIFNGASLEKSKALNVVLIGHVFDPKTTINKNMNGPILSTLEITKRLDILARILKK